MTSASPGLRPEDDQTIRELARLIEIMRRLRDPDTGCPWDVEQSFATIAPFTIEEAYEVADAIERQDFDGLRDELGDLLFQVVFHARMAEEEGRFDLSEVAAAISDKMVRRHPHVFGNADRDGGHAKWEEHKAAERAAKAETGALDGVSIALPALLRAFKLQKRASRVGFDWGAAGPVLDKIEEEIGELRAEITAGQRSEARVADEMGDLLFACANLARHLGVDPEAALRGANAKFERRFRGVEALLSADGRGPAEASLEEMEAHWQTVKREEKGAGKRDEKEAGTK